MATFKYLANVVTYSQVMNAKEICEYNDAESALNVVGDFYYDGDTIVPVREDIAFPMEKFPQHAVLISTGAEIRMRLTPATIRLGFLAYEALSKLPMSKLRVPISSTMMIDPFTGKFVRRPSFDDMRAVGVATVEPHMRDALFDKQLAEFRSVTYGRAKPMQLPIPPDLCDTKVVSIYNEEHKLRWFTDKLVERCTAVVSCLVESERDAFEPVTTTVVSSPELKVHSEPDRGIVAMVTEAIRCCASDAQTVSVPSTVLVEDDDEKPMLRHDDVIDKLIDVDEDSRTGSQLVLSSDGILPRPPSRPDRLRMNPSTHKWLPHPDHPVMERGCCRSYATPACMCDKCQMNVDVSDLSQLSCQNLSVWQYIQHSEHVNQAGMRQDLEQLPFDMGVGRFHGASLERRREFMLACSAAAITATPDECEVVYEDTQGMSFEEYTCGFTPWQVDMHDALDYHDPRIPVFSKLRCDGRVTVRSGTFALRQAVASVRTYLHPIWLNDAIIGVAMLFRRRLYMPYYIGYYDDIDIHGFTHRPFIEKGRLDVSVREFTDGQDEQGYVYFEPHYDGDSVIIMVTMELCIVPIGPFKLHRDLFWTTIIGARLPVEWQLCPVISVKTGALLGLVSPQPQFDATLEVCDFPDRVGIGNT